MPSSLDEYEILYSIGSGSYGACKKIKRKKDNKILVWKEMDYGQMTETEKQMLVSEVNLLRELKHQHIVRYYDRIIDRTNTTLYIIMEYCEGGDLANLIQRYRKEGKHADEDFIWKLFSQITSALKECHRRKGGQAVLHRDLKPANVFLDKNRNVKLGDFGLARVLNHETSFAKTFVGTPYYMSPEQMNYMQYNDKSDIWSLGCLIYELCSLHPPFTATNQKDLAIKIKLGKFSRIPPKYSDELDNVISSMLKLEGEKRPSIEDLLTHSKIKANLPGSPEPRKSLETKNDDSLRRREVELDSKEKKLNELEQGLAAREKTLKQRELLADEKLKLAQQKLAKAEKMMADLKPRKENILTSSPSNTPSDSPIYSILPSSCLKKDQRKEVTPKKQVRFNSIENQENNYGEKLESRYRSELDRHNELKYRYDMARLKTLERRNADLNLQFKKRQLLGMR